MNNLEPPTVSQLSVICSDLSSVRLILAQSGKFDLYQKIRLNVSEEDIAMAFRMDDFMKLHAL
jgi:hypothetical protein